MNGRLTYVPFALSYIGFQAQTCVAHMEYPVVLEQDLNRGHVVYCPISKDASHNEAEEEALDNINDAIKTYLDSIES